MMNKAYQSLAALLRIDHSSKRKVTLYSELVNELKRSFPKISWVGIYEKDENKDELFLSTYVGDLACEIININKGVCGKAFRERETQLVNDVSSLPYHIACSSKTKSELVIPLFENEKCVAVLDLDSEELNAFSAEDASALEEIVKLI